ncbi:universal stress protein UspA [Burkholderia ubonensis]|uniref:universal stress protein n=1 Tax=Burkholderia ubonensis TaxID=101571 RepID=UPI000753E8E1|nr:universal stress protein [Burkholderia ubonensis]KVD88312.1 universal stress protein UspA [Burkholderia ubonensis]
MYRKIMVAVDGSASSERALDEGLTAAKQFGSQVSVVYVIDKASPFTYPDRYLNELLAESRHYGIAVLRRAEQAIGKAGVKGDTELVETESVGEDVAERLQRYVQDNGIDLAVLGTHGRRGIRRMVIGSVAERFLRGSSCPVLLAHEEEAQPASTILL